MLLCLQKALNVFLGEKPWSVGQDFVEFPELLQLLRGFIQAVQPLGIPPDLEEVIHVEVHQVGTLVSSCRHDADVVSVVQREGPVHLQQVVLRPEETPQVLWVEAHHQRNVVEATEGCKRILKYRLCPGVHFTDFQNLFFRDKSTWSVS